VFAVLALRQNPRDATLSLNRFSVGVMLPVDGATQVTRSRTTCVLDYAARRTRELDIHAAITRSAVGVRRVVGYYPCRRADSNNTDENADRYPHDTAFARCERLGRWGLASVDRRRLLRAANSTVYGNAFPRLAIGFLSLNSGDVSGDEQVTMLRNNVAPSRAGWGRLQGAPAVQEGRSGCLALLRSRSRALSRAGPSSIDMPGFRWGQDELPNCPQGICSREIPIPPRSCLRNPSDGARTRFGPSLGLTRLHSIDPAACGWEGCGGGC
jgi:hypothetical protein